MNNIIHIVQNLHTMVNPITKLDYGFGQLLKIFQRTPDVHRPVLGQIFIGMRALCCKHEKLHVCVCIPCNLDFLSKCNKNMCVKTITVKLYVSRGGKLCICAIGYY